MQFIVGLIVGGGVIIAIVTALACYGESEYS